jgi:hypothetical protein
MHLRTSFCCHMPSCYYTPQLRTDVDADLQLHPVDEAY